MVPIISAVLQFGIFIIPSCQGGAIWKLDSKLFPNTNSDTQVSSGKIWVFKSPFGLLYCAALCYQRSSCSFFHYQNQDCHGYRSSEERTPLVDVADINQGSFRKYQRKDVQDGYRNLTSGKTHLHAKASTYRTTRDEGMRACQREGATLVKLDTRRKVRLFKRAFEDKKGNVVQFWLGLIKKYGNDTWYWTDGTRLGHYTNWDFWQPDNVYNENTQEICAAIVLRKYAGGKWFDLPCYEHKYFVCERS